MKLRSFSRTGIKVSPLGLGTMMFGSWGNPDHDEAISIIHAALDVGVNLIDTADRYGSGESEEIIGKALRGRDRDRVVIATKVHGSMGDDPNMRGNSRRWIVRACEASLRRLGTDHIDLYQVHRPDPDCDIDETLGALSDLVHHGKVRYIGGSTFPPSQIVEAQWTAHRRGHERFVSEQPPYSMLVRGAEHDVLPTCRRHDLAVLTWSPLAGGWLSGRWRRDDQPDTSDNPRARRVPGRFDMSIESNQRKLEAADQLADLAGEMGVTLIHLAIAWVIRHPDVTSAIIGPRTMDQYRSQIDAVNLELSDDVLDRIDEIVPPGTNFSYADAGYLPPSLTDPSERRRRV